MPHTYIITAFRLNIQFDAVAKSKPKPAAALKAQLATINALIKTLPGEPQIYPDHEDHNRKEDIHCHRADNY